MKCKIKIVQINAVYEHGSTGNMVSQIHSRLVSKGIKSYVFCPTTNSEDDGIFKIGSLFDHKLHALLYRIDGKQAWHSKLATKKLCKQIKKINPDVIHLHNLHSNYINIPILLDFLAKAEIAVLITLHDCWFMTGGCMHYIYNSCEQWRSGCKDCPIVPKFKKQSYKQVFDCKKNLFDKIHVLAVNGVSQWTTHDAKNSLLFANAKIIRPIYNWVNTSVFYPRKSRELIEEKYQIDKGKKIAVCVSQSWNNDKGLKDIIEIAKVFEDSLDIILIGECKSIITQKNIRTIGYVKDAEELCEFYSAADFLLNLSTAETFGLVSVEAMACGTPVVAYDNTGSSEIIKNNCGILVETGNVKKLIYAVEKICKVDKDYFSEECVKYVQENFEKDKQIDKYIDLYSEIYALNK